MGFAAALIAIIGWVVGRLVPWYFRVFARGAGVLAGLYAVYVLLLSAGWQVLSRTLDKWFDKMHVTAALRDRQRIVELRFGDFHDDAPDFVGGLIVALEIELGDGAGEAEMSGGAVTCYAQGPDLDQLVNTVRGVAARFPFPPDAYLWAPDLDRAGHGWVIPLGVSPAQ